MAAAEAEEVDKASIIIQRGGLNCTDAPVYPIVQSTCEDGLGQGSADHSLGAQVKFYQPIHLSFLILTKILCNKHNDVHDADA